MRRKFSSVDEYMAAFPDDVQRLLERVRTTIQKAAPTAQEGISYQMPAFKYAGRPLVYFAAFKKHIGLYPPVPASLKKEVSQYAGPKGNLQFPYQVPVPFDLITRIVKTRIKEMAKK